MGKWQHRKKTTEEEKDAEVIREASALAKSLEKPAKAKTVGRSNMPPFDGVSQTTSDRIRKAAALKLAGYSNNAIADELEISASAATELRTKHPKAFDQATKEITEQAQLKYYQNLWIVRTAISEAGPRAVRTLCDVMDSTKATPAHRLKAADIILKLLDVDFSVSNGKEELKEEIAQTIREARVLATPSTIIEAEDAEVIQDEGNRTVNAD